jgi:hypothetical protein
MTKNGQPTQATPEQSSSTAEPLRRRITIQESFSRSRQLLAGDRAFLLAALLHVIGILLVNTSGYLHLPRPSATALTIAATVLLYAGAAILARFLFLRASGDRPGWRRSIGIDTTARRFFVVALLVGVVSMALITVGLAWSFIGGVLGLTVSVIVGWLATFAPYEAALGTPFVEAFARSAAATLRSPRLLGLAILVLVLQSVAAAVPPLAFLVVPWAMGAVIIVRLNDAAFTAARP